MDKLIGFRTEELQTWCADRVLIFARAISQRTMVQFVANDLFSNSSYAN